MTKKKSPEVYKRKKATQTEEQYGLREGFWLYSLLGLMTLFSAYIFIFQFGGPLFLPQLPYAGWMTIPFIVSLILSLFCPIYIYKHAKGYQILPFARVVAFLIALLSILMLIVAIPSSGSCSVMQFGCPSIFSFIVLNLLFSNPITSIFILALILAGFIALLLSKKGSSR